MKLSWSVSWEPRVHSQKCRRLVASCEFYRLDTSLSSSCIEPVGFIKLDQVCKSDLMQLADLLQVVETICTKLVDKKS